jgi:RNA polymerase sigma-70 factor, ECF subfamily
MAGRVDTFTRMDQATTERSSTPAPCGCAADSERSAFLAWVGRLVHEHRAALARIARREGLEAADAFDTVQDAFYTFIKLPQARTLVDQPDQSRNLLAALARNVARNRRRLHALARPHVRDPAVLEKIPAGVSSIEETIAAAEEHVRLAGCLRTLAEIPRAVVTLRMLDEVAGDDVARILGISSGHVAVLLHRAKASLLACMTATEDPRS